jgi:hypothetical protein
MGEQVLIDPVRISAEADAPGVSALAEQAREALLQAIIRAAAKVGNSPTGVRDLAEAYALLERDLVPHANVVHNKA